MQIKLDFKIFLIILCYIFTRKIHAFLLIFTFLVIHELAHIITGLLLGFKIKKIKLTIVGFEIAFRRKNDYLYLYKNKNNIKRKIIIAASGPIINFLIAILGLILKNPNVVYANIIIFLVNIFPILPLDGGKILKEILNLKYNFRTINNVMIEISKYNLIIITIITSALIIYLDNYIIAIFIIYLWYLYLKERYISNMIEHMYIIIGDKKLEKKTE